MSNNLFMLAKSVKSLNSIDWKNTIIEPKIDGIRMGYSDSHGAYSRSGKPIYNINHILKELRQLDLGNITLDSELNLGNITLDGELTAKTWERTMSLAKASVTNKPNTELEYVVFDIICSKYDIYLIERRQLLERIIKKNLLYIRVIPFELSKNINRAKEIFLACQTAGYEGIMLKDINSPYVHKRSSYWLKYKSRHFTDAPTLDTMDCKIIGVTEGKGKYQGTLGALVVKQPNGQVCKVSGMADSQRNAFWFNKDKIKGLIVEVIYQELSDDGIMRFPVFRRIRKDK